MNAKRLIPYTLTFTLITLAFIPLIHIYEARSYYKIYKLTINQYGCVDTIYHYHTYKLIKKFDALDITIFKIEGEHT